MIDAWAGLFQSLCLIVGPVLTGHSDPILAAIGAGLAAAIGLALTIVRNIARHPAPATEAASFRPRALTHHSRPARAGLTRFSARPRAPGAGLV